MTRVKLSTNQIQAITYQHWLALIIGDDGLDKMGAYRGYQPNVDPSISNVFAASAFRFGHTLVQPVMPRLNANFESIDEGHLPLHKAFFAPVSKTVVPKR